MSVAKECKDDAACYGKIIADDSAPLAKREKAAIMIGKVPNGRAALASRRSRASTLASRWSGCTCCRAPSASATSSDKELMAKLESIAEKDSKRTIKTLGADLASEDQVALAVVKAEGRQVAAVSEIAAVTQLAAPDDRRRQHQPQNHQRREPVELGPPWPARPARR